MSNRGDSRAPRGPPPTPPCEGGARGGRARLWKWPPKWSEAPRTARCLACRIGGIIERRATHWESRTFIRSHPRMACAILLEETVQSQEATDSPMGRFFNRRDSLHRRRQARANMPSAEALLWSAIQGRKIAGCKFRRQHGIGPYHVDFCSPELNLVIELDGDTHSGTARVAADRVRQRDLEQSGFRVIRFSNDDVFGNLSGVCEAIERTIQEQCRTLNLSFPLQRSAGDRQQRSAIASPQPAASPAKAEGDGDTRRDSQE